MILKVDIIPRVVCEGFGRVEHAFWTVYVANVTAMGDTNDTILGLVTIYRDFILFEWDLKPYDRKSNLYKRVLFVLRVSHYLVGF